MSERAMTFGSLFAGIGGMDLGLERAGMECRWQVEIDPFCRKVLAKHWPNVKRYEDIRTVNWGEVERVDLIAGGFPCQDISNAGKRVGIEGARSGLWAEFARAIGDLRPRLVLVENVTALLARGLERVLGDLATLGYDAEWDCIPAAAVGAPHIRDRFFLVGSRDGTDAHGKRVFGSRRGLAVGPARADEGAAQERERLRADAESVGEGLPDSYRDERAQSGADERMGRIGLTEEADADGEGGRALAVGCEWRSEPAVGRVADGVPDRVDRLRGLGNAVVPQVAEWIGRRILEAA